VHEDSIVEELVTKVAHAINVDASELILQYRDLIKRDEYSCILNDDENLV
jgi:hypothetical protein